MTFRRGMASTGLLLLLASLLVGQFMATTHEFTARHVTCPRHGEVIDVDARGVSSVTAPADPATQLSAQPEDTSQTQHQHCLFVSSRGSQKGFRIVGPATASQSGAAHWTSVALADTLHPPIAVYLTAPKHSPPSA